MSYNPAKDVEKLKKLSTAENNDIPSRWVRCLASELLKHQNTIRQSEIITDLCDEECSGVTIFAPNADFGGPNFIIEAFGEWTKENNLPFSGDTLLEALENALVEKNSYK